jgi:hypothetical protein
MQRPYCNTDSNFKIVRDNKGSLGHYADSNLEVQDQAYNNSISL